MRSNSLPTSSGFTLVEVLVALVILGLAVAFLTSIISDSLMRTERIDEASRAVVLADSTLAGLGKDIPLHIGVSQGKIDGLSWRLLITPQPRVKSLQLVAVDLTIIDQSKRIIGYWQTLRVATQELNQ